MVRQTDVLILLYEWVYEVVQKVSSLWIMNKKGVFSVEREYWEGGCGFFSLTRSKLDRGMCGE